MKPTSAWRFLIWLAISSVPATAAPTLDDTVAGDIALGRYDVRLTVKKGLFVLRYGEKTMSFAKAEDFLGPIRAADEKQKFVAQNVTVTLDYQRAVAGSRTIYDLKDYLAQRATSATDECPEEVDALPYLPLSLVGTTLSYQTLDSGSGGCGPPSSSVSVDAIDTRTGQAVSLAELFDSSSMLLTIQQDKYFRSQWSGKVRRQVLAAATLPILDRLLRHDDDLFQDGTFWRHFSILSYDAKADRASVRLVVPGPSSTRHGSVTQLGLLLKPTPEFRKALVEATRGHGFFLERFRIEIGIPSHDATRRNNASLYWS